MSFFAKNLRFLRLQRGMEVPDFAELLEIYDESLRRFERDKAEPDLDQLIRIADKLDLPIDHLLCKDLDWLEKKISAKKPRLLLLDVDGTLTDGGLYYSEKGDEMKRFSVKDGMALNRSMKFHNLEVGLISGSGNLGLIGKRAMDLGIKRVKAGKGSKVAVAEAWMKDIGCNFDQVAFIGDDLNDIALIKKVGISACPADAVSAVKRAVDMVLSKKGGEGCVREFLEERLGLEL
ncbi:MAG: HAD hydrolase family protein [Bacteroidia bacterium]|nr:HAD hydrolase family protein [Bacteroidia bacterium]